MANPQEDTPRVVQMFMGTRADLAPNPFPSPVFAWDCAKCKAETYSIAKPPPETTPVCNVCVSQMTEQAEQDSSTKILWNMTNELEHSVKRISKSTHTTLAH